MMSSLQLHCHFLWFGSWFFPLWVTNCSWSLWNWMGLFYFSHSLPPTPFTKHTPASFNWGKTPTAKFSITSQWEFSNIWATQTSQPHCSVFCWCGKCLSAEESSGKHMAEWNQKRNTEQTMFMGLFMWAKTICQEDEGVFNGQDRFTTFSIYTYICIYIYICIIFPCFWLHKCSRAEVWDRSTGKLTVCLPWTVPGLVLCAWRHLWISMLLKSLCPQDMTATWLVNRSWSSLVPAQPDHSSCTQKLIGGY